MTQRLAFATEPYELTLIADASDRFSDFAPYVASVNDVGVVAFQATLRVGGSGVYTGTGGPITTVIESAADPLSEICSHPDVNRSGSACFYASLRSGGRGVLLAREGQIRTIASSGGPLGPTMNDVGTVAFRADLESGATGIFTGDGGPIRAIAEARPDGGPFRAFHGLPVINRQGAVAFRADITDGDQGIYVSAGGPPITVVETGDRFADLGRFPVMNDAGTVAFCASLEGGGSGIFAASDRTIEPLIDMTGPFESFRGVLLNNAGTIVFYATPRGGSLGVFSGPDPETDCLLSIGASLFGSTIVDFALNPVSMNAAAQVAIRVKLADGRQLILRADPVGPRESRPSSTSSSLP